MAKIENKTKGHSSASGVVIPLNDGLLSIIGEPPTYGNKDVLILIYPITKVAVNQ